MVSRFDNRNYGTVYEISGVRLTRSWNVSQIRRTLDPDLNTLFLLEIENYLPDEHNEFVTLTKDEMLALFAAFLEIYDSYGFENG